MVASTHHKTHGGHATAAKRRGEQYTMCSTCGQRSHPRLVVRQAIHVPPPGMPWWKRYLVPVAVILGALVLLAQATPT